MSTFSSEQLNFFKFATVVLDEFSVALRQVFVHMWDTKVASLPGFQAWDDSALVRNMFRTKEGGKTKSVPTNKSYKEWDCTALFEATLYAQSFALPTPGGKGKTLADLYVKPHGLPGDVFHTSVTSPSGNNDETFALALDQLRRLRNSLCHNSSSKINKKTFDQYIQLSKDAFAALGQSFSRIDDIGKLAEGDFPTVRVQQLEQELRREKLTIEDGICRIDDQLRDVASGVANLNTGVTDVKKEVEDVGTNVHDVKTEVLDTRTKVENVESNVKNVKTGMEEMRTTMEDVGSHVKDVKTGLGDVETAVKDVGFNVKEVKSGVINVNKNTEDICSDMTEVKTGLADVKTKVDELKASFDNIKQTNEAVCSKGHVVPDPFVPDEIPHFYGRQEECETILGHLADSEITRLVVVWGSPGFGKTSVAITIVHRLMGNKIPVYFVSLRGMKSKDELVSKLLSIFADVKHVPHISPSHWLIQCLQQFYYPFVLILDNADDLLESGDTTVKEEVLRLSKDILAQCCRIKLLFTTRESLDYLRHEVPIHLERVGVLDEISSAKLVKSILADVSEKSCTSMLKECGQVPLAMRLMCSIMRDENVSLSELLEELKTSTLVEVLDDDRFPRDSRLKSLLNTSFQRLQQTERKAFVSLTVFPANFEAEEARAVMDLEKASERTSKKILRALESKSLIESHDNFRSFTIHSLLRSFIDEKKFCDDATKTTFNKAQLRYYEYNISSFEAASEKFLKGRSNDAVETFVTRRETIIKSLVNGTRADELYIKATQVLSKAELFLFSVLHDEELTFNRLYDTAVEEARRKKHCNIERKLVAAKSFGCLGYFFSHEQNVNSPLQHSFIDDADCPPKLLCYGGIYKLLCGKLEEGISFLERSVDRLKNEDDEKVFMILAQHVLAVCHRKQENDEMASYFETACSVESESASLSPAFCSLFLRNTPSSSKSNVHCFPDSVAERDAFFFALTAELLPPLYKALGDQMEIELSVITGSLLRLQKVLLMMFKEGRVRARVLETCCIGLERLNCYTEAVEGFEMIAGQQEDHEDTARNYHNLGLLREKLKEYEAAQCSFKKALEMRIKLLQEMTKSAHFSEIIKDTFVSLSHLIDVSKNVIATTVDIDCFIAKCEELEGIVVKSEGDDLAKQIGTLVIIYNNLIYYCSEKEDDNKVLMSLQRAIEITKQLGDCVETAKSLATEGRVYMKMERYGKAQESFQNALDLRRKLDVQNHEDTAFICHDVGMIHLKRRKYDDALKAHLKGFQIRKTHLGDHHLLTALSLENLGFCYYKMGKYEKAAKNFSKVAKLRKMLTGSHQDTAQSFHNLSEIYVKMEKTREALSACEQAVDIRLEILPEHLDTAIELHLLGSIQFKMEDFKAAVRSFRQASKIRSRLLGDTHQDTALSYHCLGESQYAFEDFRGAVESLLTASTIRNDVLGHHSLTANTEELLGRTYNALGEHDLSSQHISKALEIRELCETTVSSDPSDPLLGLY